MVSARDDHQLAAQPERAPRVLLVEDESTVAHSFQRQLEFEGFQVDWAADGETALAMARAGSYDAIVLDRLLPKLSGDEVLEQLAREGNPTPVVIVTGHQDTESAHRAGLLGAKRYLEKGRITAADLSAAVRGAMAGVPPPAQAAPSFAHSGTPSEALADLVAWLRSGRSHEPSELIRVLAGVLIDPDVTLEEFVAAANGFRLLHEKAHLPFRVVRARILLWVQEASNPGTVDQRPVSVREGRLAPVMRRAMLELVTTHEYVSQIAYRVGYSDHADFDHDFRDFFGMTPGAFRRLW